jgi:hypothetical protein
MTISYLDESVKATAEDVFGTDSPEPDEDGVVKIIYDSPADCKGIMTVTNIDQLGNRRYNGYFSIGSWQLFHEDADLPIQPVQPDNVIVTSYSHTLMIQTDKPSGVDIYTITGQLYLRTNIQSGQTMFSVPAGLYLVRINDKSWKVVVRN